MPPSRLLAPELSALGLDLRSSLHEEPRFLVDSTFLGSLHAELRDRLGERDARSALLQLGFLHGLRDALLVVATGFSQAADRACLTPSPTLLALHLGPLSAAGGLEVHGLWPDRREAEAVASVLGACPEPACALSAGYTSGWLSGILDSELLAVEESCLAAGGTACQFTAREPAAWRQSGDPRALALLEGLPFEPLREVVREHLLAHPPELPVPEDGFEPSSPVIHVWGPVMVIPFSGPDECLQALSLIGRDPGARDVRVVVVDLGGAIIDEGFGASGLEQVLEAVEGWGAEPLLTGISPLSEAAVRDLERSHLVIRKDLPDAIATAFQIAEAQRRSA